MTIVLVLVAFGIIALAIVTLDRVRRPGPPAPPKPGPAQPPEPPDHRPVD